MPKIQESFCNFLVSNLCEDGSIDLWLIGKQSVLKDLRYRCSQIFVIRLSSH